MAGVETGSSQTGRAVAGGIVPGGADPGERAVIEGDDGGMFKEPLGVFVIGIKRVEPEVGPERRDPRRRDRGARPVRAKDKDDALRHRHRSGAAESLMKAGRCRITRWISMTSGRIRVGGTAPREGRVTMQRSGPIVQQAAP